MEQFSMLEAFMALDDLKDERTESRRSRKLKEGNTYSLHDSKQMGDAHDFREADNKNVTLEVIDTDADTLEHLKDPSDYIGEVILQCAVCKATKFVKLDSLIKNDTNAEDQVDIYNVEEECPHCHSKGRGYILIGQVGKATEETTQEAEENKEEQDASEKEAETQEPETEEEASFSNDESSDEAKLDNTESKEEEPEEFDWDTENTEEEEPEEESKNESLEEEEEETPWDETDSHEDEDLGKKTIKASSLLDDKEELKAALRAHMKNKNKDKVHESLFNKIYRQSLNEARVGKISLDRIRRRETPIEEDLSASTVTIGDFLNTLVAGAAKVNICSDNSKRVIKSLSEEEVLESFELSNTPFYHWSTEDDYIDVSVSRNGSFYIDQVFEKFVDNDNTFIVDDIVDDYLFTDDAETKECDFQGLLDTYSNSRLDGGLYLRSINFYVNQEAEAEEDTFISFDEQLIREIVRKNNLRESRLHTPNSVENFILESICEREDLDKVYEQYVKPLNNRTLERVFKENLGYKDDVDLFLESKGISPDKFNEFLENKNKKTEDECETCPDCKKPIKECTCGKEEELNEELWKSARDRKQLGTLVSILQESNMKYVVKRSTNENYRYDIYLKKNLNESVEDDYQTRKADADKTIENKGTVKLTEEPNELAPIEQPEHVDVEVVDGRRHRMSTAVTTEGTTDFDREVIHKIERIAGDIHDSIKNNYDVDVPENILVADVVRDLKLVGGAISPEELENTPEDQVEAELYRQFVETFDGIDIILSILSGQEVHTDRAERLMASVHALDSENFSTDYIEQGISSPQFLGMAANGMVPYVNAAEITRKNWDKVQALPSYRRRNPEISRYNPYEDERATQLTGGQRQASIGNRRVGALPHRRDEEFDTDKFEENVNEYLRDMYEENMVYTNDKAEVIDEGYIIHGTLDGEERSLPINWTLKKCKEGYMVTNTLSEESLTLNEEYKLK